MKDLTFTSKKLFLFLISLSCLGFYKICTPMKQKETQTVEEFLAQVKDNADFKKFKREVRKAAAKSQQDLETTLKTIKEDAAFKAMKREIRKIAARSQPTPAPQPTKPAVIPPAPAEVKEAKPVVAAQADPAGELAKLMGEASTLGVLPATATLINDLKTTPDSTANPDILVAVATKAVEGTQPTTANIENRKRTADAAFEKAIPLILAMTQEKEFADEKIPEEKNKKIAAKRQKLNTVTDAITKVDAQAINDLAKMPEAK